MGHGKAFSATSADEGIDGIPPRPDQIYPIGSYVQRGAGCHDDGDHLYIELVHVFWDIMI
eukprot:4374202-Pleurochrysis_carterae.AAC.1